MSKNNRTVLRLPMATSFCGYESVQGAVPPAFGSGVLHSDAYAIVFFDISLLYHPNTPISYLANADGTQTALVASWQNGSDTAYTYQYDANGNITQIAQGSASVTYAYDAANQLIRENNGFTNQTVTYEYDAWGNILNKKIYAYTTGDLGIPTTTDTYTYGNESWGDQLTAYNGQSIVYDEMGNPTTYLGYTMGWQGKQLISANNGTNNITYTYNEDGLRLTKTVNGTATNYYYNGSVLISMATGSTTQQFHYDASGNAIAVTYNGTEYYYVRNAQGDIVKLIDSTGATVVEYTYDSWGKLLSITGSLASTLGSDQPFRYRGYVYDTETSLYYLQTRYYDPATCRFLSSDVALSTGQGVLGHNAYAYCLNNPVLASDTEGTIGFFASLVISVAVSTAISVVSNGIANAINGNDFWDGAGEAAIEGAIGGLFGFAGGSLQCRLEQIY